MRSELSTDDEQYGTLQLGVPIVRHPAVLEGEFLSESKWLVRRPVVRVMNHEQLCDNVSMEARVQRAKLLALLVLLMVLKPG